jgi:hypothetical protein
LQQLRVLQHERAFVKYHDGTTFGKNEIMADIVQKSDGTLVYLGLPVLPCATAVANVKAMEFRHDLLK